jgi:hypothetical protein
MNKILFWLGLIFQIIQFSILGIIILSSINITIETAIIIFLVLSNVISFIFMIIGAFSE